jgi:hypothetical protein
MYNSVEFFIFIVLSTQLQQPITDQHESKYKRNNKIKKKQ